LDREGVLAPVRGNGQGYVRVEELGGVSQLAAGLDDVVRGGGGYEGDCTSALAVGRQGRELP